MLAGLWQTHPEQHWLTGRSDEHPLNEIHFCGRLKVKSSTAPGVATRNVGFRASEIVTNAPYCETLELKIWPTQGTANAVICHAKSIERAKGIARPVDT